MAFCSWFLAAGWYNERNLVHSAIAGFKHRIPMNHKATVLSTDPAGKLSWRKKNPISWKSTCIHDSPLEYLVGSACRVSGCQNSLPSSGDWFIMAVYKKMAGIDEQFFFLLLHDFGSSPWLAVYIAMMYNEAKLLLKMPFSNFKRCYFLDFLFHCVQFSHRIESKLFQCYVTIHLLESRNYTSLSFWERSTNFSKLVQWTRSPSSTASWF